MDEQNSLTIRTDELGVNDLVERMEAEWGASMALRVSALELAPATKALYTTGARRFLAWCETAGVELVTGDTVLAWQASLVKAGYKPNTIGAWMAGVRAFFGWGVGRRLIAVNPTSGVRGPKRRGTNKKHLRQPLTDGEVRGVLAQPDTTTAKGKRDMAILALLAYTAIRSIEVQRADLVDLHTEGNRLVLALQGKGRQEKDEIAVLPVPAEAAVYEWLRLRGSAPGALFWSLSPRSRGRRLSLRAIRGIVKGYYQAAGVVGEGKTTHSLRHSALSAAARVLPLQKVQSLARHASPQTTTIYYHELDRLTNPAEDLIFYGE